jgi:hypothetical protein
MITRAPSGTPGTGCNQTIVTLPATLVALDEIVSTLRHWVDTGIHADAESAAEQLVDAPPLAP